MMILSAGGAIGVIFVGGWFLWNALRGAKDGAKENDALIGGTFLVVGVSCAIFDVVKIMGGAA